MRVRIPFVRIAALSVGLFCAPQAGSPEGGMNPPRSVRGWSLAEPKARIDSSGIFQYMDGAGELYLGYRFESLEVYTYRRGGAPEILVEIYNMGGPDDAYGLLSQDWGGEPLGPVAGSAPAVRGFIPSASGLYGAGLLRSRAGNAYLRILAAEETPDSRAAVMELASILAPPDPTPPPPAWLDALPGASGGWVPQPESVRFFRSRHVFNSVYFLSYLNILRLDRSVEAAHAEYRTARDRAHLFAIRYPGCTAASAAFAEFCAAYFPELRVSPGSAEAGVFLGVTGGWAGIRMCGQALALVFDAPDRDLAEGLLAAAIERIPSRKEDEP